MRESKSIFFPIQSKFSNENIFAKRHSQYKRSIKTSMAKTECLVEHGKPVPVYDTYSKIKKRLEEYILQEKSKHNLYVNSQEYQLSNSKTKLVFRKRCKSIKNKTEKSTIVIPSEQLKNSFTQLIANAKNKQKNINIIQFCLKPSEENYQNAQCPQKKKRYNIIRRTKCESSKEKEEQAQNKSKSLQSLFRSKCLRRRPAKSVNQNSEIRINSQAMNIDNQNNVIICRGGKTLEITELQNKRDELMRLNQTLKLKNAIKFKLRRRTQQQFSNEVGPWSKKGEVEQDEIRQTL